MKTKTFLKTLLVGLVLAFFGCTEETIINNIVDDTDGKVNIYIEGNITNAEAQAQLTAEIGTQTENIYVQNTTQLTAITINAIGNMRDIVIKNNTLLTTININFAGNSIQDIVVNNYASTSTINVNGNTSKANLIEIRVAENSNVNLNGFIELNNIIFSGSAIDNSNQFICNDLIKVTNTLDANINGILKFNHLKI